MIIIIMLVLDLLLSKLIFILRFEVLQTNPMIIYVEKQYVFARSNSMVLNNFLIQSKALSIRLVRNLVTESYEDHFTWMHKW